MSRELVDSGVKWIGKIPKEWKIRKLKYLTHIQTGNTPSKEKQNVYYSNEDGIKWVKADNLGSSIDIRETTEYLTTEGIKQGRLFPKNSIYVCCIASIGKTGFITDQASCNQQINSLDFYNAYWKYGYYLTLAQENEYFLNATGNVVKILNSERQGNIICPFPSLIEQEKIANYLDNKISKIEQTIEDNKKEIELLEEYKNKDIDERINKNHFKKIKIKYLVNVRNEKDSSDGKSVFIGLENIESFTTKYIETSTNFINSDGKVFKKGDLIINKLRPYLAKTYLAEFDGICTGEAEVLSKFSGNMSFFKYFTISNTYLELVNSSTYGTKMPRVNWDFIKNIKIPYPDINLQNDIVKKINKTFNKIYKSIEIRQQIINKLEEYKKSLIYEVVTGKKEV